MNIDYDNLQYHPFTEKVVNSICNRVGTDERSFFRNHVNYYLTAVAAMMRASIKQPGKGMQPVNTFVVNLAPTGFGKGHSTAIIENELIHTFRDRFVNETLPLMAEQNIPKLAVKRAARKGTDPTEEEQRTHREFGSHGTLLFSFDSATPAAIKQLRNMLLMANAGAMNFQVDEIGANLMSNLDIMGLFLELFDGSVKQKLVKNTTDSIRSEEIQGITPTNMMLFGVPNALLDGGKTEETFNHLLGMGYARRCFFGYVNDEVAESKPKLLSPQEKLDKAKQMASDNTLAEASKHLGNLANMINAHKQIIVPDETSLLYFEYENDCAQRAHNIPIQQDLVRSELKQRFFKAMKLAAAYAFIDESPEVTPDHYRAAIKVAEDSGEAFQRIQKRDRTYMKLAKFMARIPEEVTHTDLIEDLPFYPKASNQQRELINQAISWGYKNNIIIKKRFTDGIEFLRGETLKETDLDKLRVAYSQDIAVGYKNEVAPWDKLHVLTQANGLHWVNHFLSNGEVGLGHRKEDQCEKGFNLIVLDIDKGTTLEMAKQVLKGHKALYYTTKRHTPDEHRFRIILPTNYELALDDKDYKEFMKNLFESLPFQVDSQVGQRARKWLSCQGHYEYTDGELFDVLPYIPKTSKNEERQRRIQDLQNLDNLERWVINTTGDGNRNNQLLRFAMILVDGGFKYEDVQRKVLDMNDKLADKLEESEIFATVMTTVGKAIAKRDA
ncbi:hypothetical protein [Marinobacter shengliensis]|uniref:hypothetical protein n=1 Tax=Marinobacter shengliensis TaxID=1389223 RepID=UPI001E643D32|nr:hypothetical protein [Marinobacter shengliensis]MCD1628454.1 hypothetical protein [Marinobacter shengliensis]